MRPWGLAPVFWLPKQPENSVVIGRTNHVTDGETVWESKSAAYVSQGLMPALRRIIDDSEKFAGLLREINRLEKKMRVGLEKNITITQSEYRIFSTKEEAEQMYGTK
jgi:hypothetical protein